MKNRLASLWGLTMVLLPACTAVLGMDRAELDENLGAAGTAGAGGGSGGTGGAGGQRSQLVECTAVIGECVDCLKSCSADVNACLANDKCRIALSDYGGCLDKTCADQTGNCSEVLSQVDEPNAQKLASCLSFNCSENGACTGSTVFTKCQRYCACMQSKCQGEFTWPATDECLRDCQLLEPRVQDCRGDHCEYGSILHDHCIHAKGNDPIMDPCKDVPASKTCLIKSDVKGPCKVNADCCPGLTCFNQECGN